jgi:DNA helicase-2/ATP-dependent DNA helicase PcrA
MTDTWTIEVGEPEHLAVPRSRLAGTPQQEAFWAELLDGSGHVLLEARAGTGKSTSCREAMWRLLEAFGSLAIRYCCFNKAIADDFRPKCPAGVEVGTMHSFGLRALGRTGQIRIEKDRTYLILDSLGLKEPRWLRKAVATLVSLAKNHALRPGQGDLFEQLDDLVLHYAIECYGRDSQVVDLAVDVLDRCVASTDAIDFDDMLWLPVLLGVQFPSQDFLFIDECQDLNPVQHALAERMAGGGRTVIVGDPFQAVYGFRGADTDSIPNLRDQLGAKTLPLTVTFRCPKSHVALARELVPDFEAAAEAPEGELATGKLDDLASAGPGDLVLCRANAPLVSACLDAIRNRRRAVMRGRAFGDQLAAVLRRIDAPTILELITGIQRWKARELAKYESRDGCEDLVEQVSDKADALEAIADTCDSPAEVPGVIQELFDDRADAATRITFSSVHRAKGSEARRVLFLDKPYCDRKPPAAWEADQRRNLRYVALTRSLQSLTLIPCP